MHIWECHRGRAADPSGPVADEVSRWTMPRSRTPCSPPRRRSPPGRRGGRHGGRGAAEPGRVVVTMFAAWHLGACVTPVNPALTSVEAGYQIQDSGAKVVVGDPAVTSATTLDVAALQTRVRAGPCQRARRPVGRPRAGHLHQRYDRPAQGRHARPRQRRGDVPDDRRRPGAAGRRPQPAHPAAVPRQRDHGERAVPAARRRPDDDRRQVPAGHLLRRGRTRPADVLFRGPRDLCDARQPPGRGRSGHVVAAPGRLRRRSDAAELIGAFEQLFRVPVVEGYGLSEGGCASTLNPPHGPRKPGTVGLPLPGQEVALFHADGRIDRDGVGEVVIKGPNVMRGYLNRPEEPRGPSSTVGCNRRRRPVRRRRVSRPCRPDQGHDHPRRGEHLSQGDRERPVRAPGCRRGRGRRRSAPRVRRDPGRVRRPAGRLDGDRRPPTTVPGPSPGSRSRRDRPGPRAPQECRRQDRQADPPQGLQGSRQVLPHRPGPAGRRRSSRAAGVASAPTQVMAGGPRPLGPHRRRWSPNASVRSRPSRCSLPPAPSRHRQAGRPR